MRSFRTWPKKLKVLLLLLIVALEMACIFRFLTTPEPTPSIAYLSKVGADYLIVWNTMDPAVEPLVKRVGSVSEAVRFARAELHLELRVPRETSTIEWLRIDSRANKHVLHWKLESNPHLLRLTFDAREDAETFASAFKLGAYRASPIGHSFVLLPPTPKSIN